MAEFKDFIPMGNDNDANSGDSWFVLSSASEEEEDEEESEPVDKKPKVIQVENLQKEIAEKKVDDPIPKEPKIEEMINSQKEVDEEKENEPVNKKQKMELENFYKEITTEKEENEPVSKKPKMEQLENCHKETTGKEENDLVNKKLKVEQMENFQIETVSEKENDLIDKKTKLGQSEDSQKERNGKKENETVDKKLKIEEKKHPQKEIAEEKPDIEKSETALKKEKNVQKDEHEKSQTFIKEKKEKQVVKELEKLEDKTDKRQKINSLEHKDAKNEEHTIPQKESVMAETEKINSLEHKDAKIEERAILQKESVMAETEKMTKNRRKPKGLATNEESHNEVALEVHALRETLIQLSLNLSNTEEEKYTAITSEVQALRETVSQLNNDLSNRVSQIETRTEQVHTLLCRFIMTRCGSYKEPITHVINTVKEHHPDTSNVAVQTEMVDIKQTPLPTLSESSSVPFDQNISKNENRETLPIVNISSQVGRMDDIKQNHAGKEVKDLSSKPDFPFEEKSDNLGLKRPRPDAESSQISKEPLQSNEISEELSSYPSLAPPKRDERNKFSKEKSYNRYKPRDTKLPTEHYRGFRGSFHQYQNTHQTTAYGPNRELAELAYHYSTENDRRWRKNKSNRSWQLDSRRKYPYSRQTQEGQDIYSSDIEMNKPSDDFTDGIDDYMDKVIDEWAQDEDDD